MHNDIVTFDLFWNFIIINVYLGCIANLSSSIIGCIKVKVLGQSMLVSCDRRESQQWQKVAVCFFAVTVGKEGMIVFIFILIMYVL